MIAGPQKFLTKNASTPLQSCARQHLLGAMKHGEKRHVPQVCSMLQPKIEADLNLRDGLLDPPLATGGHGCFNHVLLQPVRVLSVEALRLRHLERVGATDDGKAVHEHRIGELVASALSQCYRSGACLKKGFVAEHLLFRYLVHDESPMPRTIEALKAREMIVEALAVDQKRVAKSVKAACFLCFAAPAGAAEQQQLESKSHWCIKL